jgi:phosphate:Na+ symporter
VFLALRLIVTASAPLRDASLFHLLLTSLAGEPLLAFLIAAGVTWLSYSSLSVILLVASFVASGSLAPEGAAAMILGVNLGAGLPALSASRSLPPEIRRMPMANFVSRGLVAILLLGFTQPVSAFIAQYVQSAVGQVTTFHILFNLVVLSLGLIFAAPLMQVMERLLPEKEVPEDGLQKPRYLDRGALHTPAVALANAAQETVRMAEILDRMLHLAMEALKHSSLERLKGVRQTDEMINSYHREIHGYLSDLSQADIDSSEGRHALEIMLYVSNLEHAGDLIELSLADRIKAKVKENIEFTPDERTSLQALSAIVSASLKLACGVIASNDLGGARRLISQKDKFRIIENKILDAHFREPTQKVAKNLRRRALFVDMVRDLHTIHSHITSAAYPIVDAAGLLRDSRLRNSKKI